MRIFDNYYDFIDFVRRLDNNDGKELDDLLTYHDVDGVFIIDDDLEEDVYVVTLLEVSTFYLFNKLLKKLLELGATAVDEYLSGAISFQNYIGASALVSHGARCMNTCWITNSQELNIDENSKYIVNVAEMVSEHVDMLPQVRHFTEKIAAKKRSIEHMFALDAMISFIY